jgi:hypothetical protein
VIVDGPRLHSRVEGVPVTDGASTASTVEPSSEPDTSSPSDRLRWIADYLDLADKAIGLVACVQGVDYPSDLHQGAQRDLRRWAHWLDASPVAADGFATARLDPWSEGVAVGTRGERHH